MILLFDIGNTNTHLGLVENGRIAKNRNIPTAGWMDGTAENEVRKFIGASPITGAALCSVAPPATPFARQLVRRRWRLPLLELSPETITGGSINYSKPQTIGPDRLA